MALNAVGIAVVPWGDLEFTLLDTGCFNVPLSPGALPPPPEESLLALLTLMSELEVWAEMLRAVLLTPSLGAWWAPPYHVLIISLASGLGGLSWPHHPSPSFALLAGR